MLNGCFDQLFVIMSSSQIIDHQKYVLGSVIGYSVLIQNLGISSGPNIVKDVSTSESRNKTFIGIEDSHCCFVVVLFFAFF